MYTKKSLLQKVLCFAAAVFFVLAFVCMGLTTVSVRAAVAGNEVYGEDWEYKDGADSIFFEEFAADTSTDWSIFRMNEPVTLAAGEKLELNFTVTGAVGAYIMPSLNPVTVWEDTSNLRPYGGMRINFGAGIGINNVYWDYNVDGVQEARPDIISAAITGLVHLLPGESNTGDGCDAFIVQNSTYNESGSISDNWIGAGTTVGDADGWTYASPLMLKVVYGADGSIYYYAKNAQDAGWSTLCFIEPGIKVLDDFYADNPDAGAYGIKAGEGLPVEDEDQRWDEASGDYYSEGGPVLTDTAVYPAVAIAKILTQQDFTMSNMRVYKIGADEQRTVVATNKNDWQAYTANGENRITQTASDFDVTIDNAAAGDVLLKSEALASVNAAGTKAFDISFDISAQDITGTGKGVIYISGSKTDFANAAQIYFDIDGMGVINDDEVIPEYPMTFAAGEFKTVRIESLKSGENKVYVDDELAATFNLDLSGKYIAFGTEPEDGTATIKVKNFSLTEHKAAETDGAAIRIVEGEAGSMRFISSFSKEEIASLGADSYKIGTVIKGGVYTGDELTVETAGALKIENGAGYWKETTEEYVISAYIYGIDQAHYATEVSARAYIEYVKDGETKYIYGDVISRSLSSVAEAALADVSDVQDEVYQYDLGNGTFSPYDEATRAILQTYISEI